MTLSTPGGLVTVRYDACAAMTTRPDGARCLTGLDGFGVAVEPTLYGEVTAERIAVLDKAVPAAAVVPLPARPAEEIPQPRERTAPAPWTPADESRRTEREGASGRVSGHFVFVTALATLWPVLLVTLVVNGIHEPSIGFAAIPGFALEFWLLHAARNLYRTGQPTTPP
ncbi:hypothetical protein [Streptomyces sp. LUP47B]|uniref:hypothetical protein n=1 Tax=Streptomyces sp. LUP47B TaxID=1890286 RepID=UPI0008519823|nr:hypothetical protein [Streptomyces sp. LUP47B]